MANQLFEVAFSGKISDGSNLNEVKAKVGKMFNADDAKIAQLFSGRRIVIKKNIDQAIAAKYKTALNRAGAECEVKPMGRVDAAPASVPEMSTQSAPTAGPAATVASTGSAASIEYESSYDGEVEPPPQTDPLGITGDDIEDLPATLAPVGSELQDEYSAIEEPQFDTAAFDIAPVGSDLSDAEKKPDPAPPNVPDLNLVD